MRALTRFSLALVIVAALGGSLYWGFQEHRNALESQRKLEDQARQIADLKSENESLSHLKNQQTELEQLRENTKDLLKLRNEVRQLRNQQAETEHLRAANTRLLDLLQKMQLTPTQAVAVAEIRSQGAVIGIVPADLPNLQKGVRVAGIDPGSPVAQSGLMVGDVILGLDGAEVESTAQLQALMLTRQAGELVQLDVARTNGVLRIPVRTRDWPH